MLTNSSSLLVFVFSWVVREYQCFEPNGNSTFGTYKIYSGMRSLAFPFKNLKASNEIVCLLSCNALPRSFGMNIFQEIKGFSCSFFDLRSMEEVKLNNTETGDHYEKEVYKDCHDVATKGGKQSGVYDLVHSEGSKFKTYCDMTTSGGGWTLVQRQTGKPFDFQLPLINYKAGFGDPLSDFWLGIEELHALTRGGEYTVRFDLWFNGEQKYAEYQNFIVGAERGGYQLTLGTYQGTIRDSLRVNIGLRFSTIDNDLDINDYVHCADVFGGGWWFRACGAARLNVDRPQWKGVFGNIQLSKTEIKIRRTNL